MALKFIPIVALAMIFVTFYNWNTFEPESIRGKRILITGSSTGIGEQLAYEYSKLGASLVITARREEPLQKVASKCKELGAKKVEYVVADMERAEDRHRLVCETEKHLGGLDYLILNHVVSNSGEWVGSSEQMIILKREMNINFIAYVDIASKCLRMLIASNGNIGVMSSISGKVGMAYLPIHSTWKFALQGFFSTLRQELRLQETDVSITFVVLGYVDTDNSRNVYVDNFPHDTNMLQTGVPNEAAKVVIKGVAQRSFEVYYPTDVRFYVVLSAFFPGYIEDYLSLYMYRSKYGF